MAKNGVMSREDYEDLFIIGNRLEGWPEKIHKKKRAELLAKRYPCRTETAAGELRSRGLDVRYRDLVYLVERGTVEPEKDDKGNYVWTPKMIDAAAEHFAAAERLTYSGHFWALFGIDPGQDRRAKEEVRMMNPMVNPDLFVVQVFPGAPFGKTPAITRYRVMTAEEEADWRRRIKEIDGVEV